MKCEFNNTPEFQSPIKYLDNGLAATKKELDVNINTKSKISMIESDDKIKFDFTKIILENEVVSNIILEQTATNYILKLISKSGKELNTIVLPKNNLTEIDGYKTNGDQSLKNINGCLV